MSQKFRKYKLLLDENMPPRTDFNRLNHLFDVKHIAIDLKKAGIPDEQVHKEAEKLNRLLVTFNGIDFRHLAEKSKLTGIIHVSHNLLTEQIDTKLIALLLRSTPNTLFGKFTIITGETEA